MAMLGENPLKIESATKHYPRGGTVVHALRGVNFQAHPGELVAIMGASGSGKSTLLHIAAGLVHPDGGRVWIGGQNLAELSDARLTHFRRQNVGIVFQSFNLIPSLTAEENIRLPAQTGKGLDEKVDRLLNQLGLGERRDHKPDALSGGEQQRVAIARALICDPTILLADEPTGSLDSVTGQEICQLLRSLRSEQGRTVVVVTHEPTVAMWADRVVVLRDGVDIANFTVEKQGDSKLLADAYQNAIATSSVSPSA